jgi:hypothetical protein
VLIEYLLAQTTSTFANAVQFGVLIDLLSRFFSREGIRADELAANVERAILDDMICTISLREHHPRVIKISSSTTIFRAANCPWKNVKGMDRFSLERCITLGDVGSIFTAREIVPDDMNTISTLILSISRSSRGISWRK